MSWWNKSKPVDNYRIYESLLGALVRDKVALIDRIEKMLGDKQLHDQALRKHEGVVSMLRKEIKELQDKVKSLEPKATTLVCTQCLVDRAKAPCPIYFTVNNPCQFNDKA